MGDPSVSQSPGTDVSPREAAEPGDNPFETLPGKAHIPSDKR